MFSNLYILYVLDRMSEFREILNRQKFHYCQALDEAKTPISLIKGLNYWNQAKSFVLSQSKWVLYRLFLWSSANCAQLTLKKIISSHSHAFSWKLCWQSKEKPNQHKKFYHPRRSWLITNEHGTVFLYFCFARMIQPRARVIT